VLGVVGGPEKEAVARRFGADVVVDRRREDFVAVVPEATGGRGADVVYEPVGGETDQRSTKCVAFEGRILVFGFAGGTIKTPPLSHALVKNYSVVGLRWGQYATVDPAAVRACHDELTRLVDTGAISLLVTERLALEALAEGVQRLADGATIGRVTWVAAP